MLVLIGVGLKQNNFICSYTFLSVVRFMSHEARWLVKMLKTKVTAILKIQRYENCKIFTKTSVMAYIYENRNLNSHLT
jgi:hypothetical protein